MATDSSQCIFQYQQFDASSTSSRPNPLKHNGAPALILRRLETHRRYDAYLTTARAQVPTKKEEIMKPKAIANLGVITVRKHHAICSDIQRRASAYPIRLRLGACQLEER